MLLSRNIPSFFGGSEVPPTASSGGGGGGGGAATSAASGAVALGCGSGDFGFSGIGHICIVIVQSGSTTVSQTCGSMISPLGPTKS